MTDQPRTVLLIAAPTAHASLRDVLRTTPFQGYRLAEASGGAEGLRRWHSERPDCVLLDDRLPDMPAREVLAALVQATGGNAPVALLASGADAAVVLEALERGAQDCLDSDHITAFELQRAIANTIAKVRLRRARPQAEASLDGPGHPDRATDQVQRLARYQLLFAHMRDIVLFVRPNGQLVEANRAALTAYGYDRATLLSLTIYDLRDPATAPLILPQLAQADQDGIRFETVHRRHDGSTFPVEVSSVGADIDGERLLLSVVRDISARTRIEQDLREREQFISAVLHTTPNLIYVHDLVKNKTIYLNDQIERLFGHTLAEVKALGDNLFLHLAHPRDLPGLRAHLERLRHAPDDAVLAHEFRARHHDGTWHWLSSHDRVFDRDHTGAARTVLGIASDSTARKQAEARQHLFEQVVLNMNDALLITEAEPIDEPGPRIVYANPAFTRMTGYALEEVLGKNPRFLQGPDSARAELDKLRTALRRWKSARVELVNYHKDGSAFNVEFDVAPVADATGWYTHWISVQREVTARKRAEAERAELLARAQAARVQAEEAVQVRDQFLSIAAHELKNPLAALLGNAQLLDRRTAQSGALSERELRMVQAIREQAGRLNGMITSLLDVSRIEMGQLPISRAPLDLAALVSRIVEDLRPTLTRHTLRYSGPVEALFLAGDALRLEQVLQNLLGNAIKYSPQGGVVTVSVEQREAWGCVVITDEGIGIPPDAVPHLFKRFYRAANIQKHIAGTGVGLYVVKEIVARHGGEVQVQSTEGVGSTFTVCLRIGAPAPTLTTDAP
ncbi:MAG: PAS domain S-box protein [Chloroflexales bacterium]|nr:PAS domain S-box protein [Chloroflexales bacterium]